MRLCDDRRKVNSALAGSMRMLGVFGSHFIPVIGGSLIHLHSCLRRFDEDAAESFSRGCRSVAPPRRHITTIVKNETSKKQIIWLDKSFRLKLDQPFVRVSAVGERPPSGCRLSSERLEREKQFKLTLRYACSPLQPR